MSEHRMLRALCSSLLLAGAVTTALILAEVIPPQRDGGLIFPLAAIIGLVGLITLRPRTTNRKDRRNG